MTQEIKNKMYKLLTKNELYYLELISNLQLLIEIVFCLREPAAATEPRLAPFKKFNNVFQSISFVYQIETTNYFTID